MKNLFFALALLAAPVAAHAQSGDPNYQQRQQQANQSYEQYKANIARGAQETDRRNAAAPGTRMVLRGSQEAHPGMLATRAAKEAWRRDRDALEAREAREKAAKKQVKANKRAYKAAKKARNSTTAPPTSYRRDEKTDEMTRSEGTRTNQRAVNLQTATRSATAPAPAQTQMTQQQQNLVRDLGNALDKTPTVTKDRRDQR